MYNVRAGVTCLKKGKGILSVCAVAFSVNAALFLVKLYIGLRTNSISIYSDAVNNLFDSLSGLITLVSMRLIVGKSDFSTETTSEKSEQLFSFLISLAVVFTGFYFAYSSLERLMYPTPVWYTWLYLSVLMATAAVKIGLFAFYKAFYKKTNSPVINVMAYDSVLDFFITCVTVLTLYISGKGKFSIDAVFGIIISVIIVISALKLAVSAVKKLIDYVKFSERDELEKILALHGADIKRINYISFSDKTEAYVCAGFENDCDLELLKKECEEKTGIILNIII